MPSIVSVQVRGFSDDSSASIDVPQKNAYDPSSPVQILGTGHLSERRKASLTLAERSHLSE